MGAKAKSGSGVGKGRKRTTSNDLDMNELIEAINESHLCMDHTAKLKQLSTIKENLFHRKKYLLDFSDEIIKLMYEFIYDGNANIQKFMVNFWHELAKTKCCYFDAYLRSMGHVMECHQTKSIVLYKRVYFLLMHETLNGIVDIFKTCSDHMDETTTDNDQNQTDSDALWLSFQKHVDILLHSMLLKPPKVVFICYSIQHLQMIILLCSEPIDIEYRDKTRSSIQPDENTLYEIFHRNPHMAKKVPECEMIVKKCLDGLSQRLQEEQVHLEETLTTREYCMLINSLSIICILRPQYNDSIINALIAFETKTRNQTLSNTSKHTIRHVLKGNFLRILRLPTAKAHAENLLHALISLDAEVQASNAITKANEPRRKFRDADNYKMSLSTLKRTMDGNSVLSENVKRRKASTHQENKTNTINESDTSLKSWIKSASPLDVIDFIVKNMSYYPIDKAIPSMYQKPIKDILKQIASEDSLAAVDLAAQQVRDPRRRREAKITSLESMFNEEEMEKISNEVEDKDVMKNVLHVAKEEELEEDEEIPSAPKVEVSNDNEITFHIPVITNEEKTKMALLSIRRIIENEKDIEMVGKMNLRKDILCKLISNRWILFGKDYNENTIKKIETQEDLPLLYQELLDYVLEKYHPRHDILLNVLDYEYAYETSEIALASSRIHGLYDVLLTCFITRLQSKIDPGAPSDRNLFRQIYSKVPVLNISCLNILDSLLKDEQSVVLSITTLRDLITERSMYTLPCLQLLLNHTSCETMNTRNTTIRCVVNQLYFTDKLEGLIEQHAKRLLYLLISDHVKRNEFFASNIIIKEEKEQKRSSYIIDNKDIFDQIDQSQQQQIELLLKSFPPMKIDDIDIHQSSQILQHLELYLALCAKNEKLFYGLIQVYEHGVEMVQNTLFKSIEKLVKHLKQKKGEMVVLKECETFNMKSIGLICHIVDILCDHTTPSQNLRDKVIEIFNQHQEMENACNLLIPIVSGFTPSLLHDYLPYFLNLPEPRLILSISKLTEMKPIAIEPKDFLVLLHHFVEEEKHWNKHQKSIIHVIDLCKDCLRNFGVEAFGLTLTMLVEEKKIPRLTLRTMMVSVSTFPRLKNIIINLLQRLIQRKIWEMDSTLWKGFMKCTSLLQPYSFPLLYQLPLDILQILFTNETSLKELFQIFASTKEEYPKTSLELRDYLQLVAPLETENISSPQDKTIINDENDDDDDPHPSIQSYIKMEIENENKMDTME